jgi:hypothetical protein
MSRSSLPETIMAPKNARAPRRPRTFTPNVEAIRTELCRRGWTLERLASEVRLSLRTIQYLNAGQRAYADTLTRVAVRLLGPDADPRPASGRPADRSPPDGWWRVVVAPAEWGHFDQGGPASVASLLAEAGRYEQAGNHGAAVEVGLRLRRDVLLGSPHYIDTRLQLAVSLDHDNRPREALEVLREDLFGPAFELREDDGAPYWRATYHLAVVGKRCVEAVLGRTAPQLVSGGPAALLAEAERTFARVASGGPAGLRVAADHHLAVLRHLYSGAPRSELRRGVRTLTSCLERRRAALADENCPFARARLRVGIGFEHRRLVEGYALLNQTAPARREVECAVQVARECHDARLSRLAADTAAVFGLR